MRADTNPASMMGGGWVASGSFMGSILSGMLLGYLVDRWLGSEPWMLLIGFGLGAYSGFLRLWQLSKDAEEKESRAGR